MRAIAISEPGGPEVLGLTELPEPVPGPGEVLINVHAAGINRADIVQRQGFYPPPPGAPATPGLEVSGTVAVLGDGVDSWKPGERVCALLAGGGYAERAVAAAAECLPIPDELSFEEAAGLPEVVLTVWSNVMQRAAIRPGESFLVHGGSSGIGTAAIQMLSAYGCPVFATAGSAAKTEVCEALGATRCINYREQDFVAELLAATDGQGVDVILDMVGGDYVDRNIQLAAVNGRIVNIAYLQGSKVSANLMPVMLKRLTLTGSTLRAREPEFKAALVSEVRHQAWPWLDDGRLQAVIHQVFSYAEASEAHRVMEASTHIGKLVLSWEP